MTLTLFCYVTLTSDDLETTSKQLAGHMLVRNDTLFVIVHHLFQMLCTNPEVYGRWRPFWICVKIGDLPWRDLWGFSTVDRKGTNELISGEKPFIAILSNLKCLFTRLLHVCCESWRVVARQVVRRHAERRVALFTHVQLHMQQHSCTIRSHDSDNDS